MSAILKNAAEFEVSKLTLNDENQKLENFIRCLGKREGVAYGSTALLYAGEPVIIQTPWLTCPFGLSPPFGNNNDDSPFTLALTVDDTSFREFIETIQTAIDDLVESKGKGIKRLSSSTLLKQKSDKFAPLLSFTVDDTTEGVDEIDEGVFKSKMVRGLLHLQYVWYNSKSRGIRVHAVRLQSKEADVQKKKTERQIFQTEYMFHD